jgi:hypothetical protein
VRRLCKSFGVEGLITCQRTVIYLSFQYFLSCSRNLLKLIDFNVSMLSQLIAFSHTDLNGDSSPSHTTFFSIYI